MRLVHLNRRKDYSPLAVILRHGCGPHFVLNRLELFESMLRDQGVTFWFRFWLDFCYYPGCEDLATINNEWPEMRDYINTGVHTLFVKGGSHEEAFQYSLNVIKLMRFNLPDLKTLLSITAADISKLKTEAIKKRKKDYTFFDMLQSSFIKCTAMAFGANLCAIFYEWLVAQDADETSEYYWCAPEEYFEKDFKPGELEIFLANEWQEQLVWLLGVSYYQVPWLRKLLTGKLNSFTQIEKRYCNKTCNVQDFKLVAKLLSIKRNEKRMAIQRVDEMSNVYENKNSKFKNDRKRQPRSRSKISLQEKKETARSCGSSSTLKYQKCAHCCKVIKRKRKPSVVCKRCVDEKWMKRRCYCNSFCKVQHWYQDHQKEHYDVKKYCSAESFSKTLPRSVTKTIT